MMLVLNNSKGELMEEQIKPKKTKKEIVKIVAAIVITLLANMLFFLMIWILDRYDDVQFDQILYQIKSPIAGTGGGLVGNALLRTVGLGALTGTVEILIYLLLAGVFKDKFSKFKGYVKYSATRVARFFKKRFMPMSAALLVASIFIFIFRLGMHSFIINQIDDSDFLETHYVDPDKTKLTFPEQKRNLIYIFLESMEATYADTSAGGNVSHDLIPELSELANNNISFAGNNGISGAYTYTGTTWTAAAMVTQSSGVPIKVALDFKTYGDGKAFMPGITVLGDILEAEGYNQSVVLGSDANFAARSSYYKQHGNHHIVDVYSLIDDGVLPEGYWQWWGFEDEKLFEESKKELTRLAALGEPFSFTTLTADTHFPDGYDCRLCPDESNEQYANVLACSSRQVYDFVNWCKDQPFYENTTIVISGDHLTMDPNFLAEIDENYVRTVYNCIINAPIEPVRENGREFATFDMFPTTLAALGVEIEGNRLGLGTNLFSSEQTLAEMYGRDVLQDELTKNSDFYFNKFCEEK